MCGLFWTVLDTSEADTSKDLGAFCFAEKRESHTILQRSEKYLFENGSALVQFHKN